MAGTSLVKFMNHQSTVTANGVERLHWGRADVDGYPFKGPLPPSMPEEEIEQRLVKTADPHVRTFDLSSPDDTAAYVDVLDKITNGWAHLLHREHIQVPVVTRNSETGERRKDVKMKVYVEWAEINMVDGKPMHSQRPYIGRPNDD